MRGSNAHEPRVREALKRAFAQVPFYRKLGQKLGCVEESIDQAPLSPLR